MPLHVGRSIARGALTAVAYCHSKGVAHGSLGSGSFLVNTFEDRRADSVIVKITNFGFAQRWSNSNQETQSGHNPPITKTTLLYRLFYVKI